MTTVNIDIETRSACELFTSGGFKYAMDPSTRILCYAYKIDEQPVKGVIGEEVPEDLHRALKLGAEVRGWNVSGFDVPVWNNRMPVPIEAWQVNDTMDRARVIGIPAMLKKAAVFMNLNIRKDLEGHKLMMKLCKADNPEPTESELDRLLKYCMVDVGVEAAIAARIPPLPDFEQPVVKLSHKINARGYLVDTYLAAEAVKFAESERLELADRLIELTDGEVTRHTQRARIFNYLNKLGADLPNLQKQTLEDALEHATHPTIRQIIDIRLSGAKASTAKFQAALDLAGSDDRVRGTLVYYGASATGRWSGRAVQPHNLPRETADDPYSVLGDIKAGQVKSVYKSLSTLLRPMIMAPKGRKLVRSDFSAIEGRVVAWLADDKPALKEYRGEGKLYEQAAAGIYHIRADQVTKQQRLVGKVAELALGFQGGYKAFDSMARNYGVKVAVSEAKQIVKNWRKSRPAVVRLWDEIEASAIQAYKRKGRPVQACKGKVQFVVDPATNDMWIQLPSGRFICLPDFKATPYDSPYGPRTRLTYKRGNWTPAAGQHEWPRGDTYGGSLVESLAQGIARDLLAVAMLEADEQGMDIVMHVHDEIIVECDDAEAEGVKKELAKIMSTTPAWAWGLPLDAEPVISQRFGK